MRWPLHPEPLPCESLSSWIYRTAQSYDFSATELLRTALRFRGPLQDIDHEPPKMLLDELALRTGTPIERLSLMSLSGLLAYGTNTGNHSEKNESDYLGTHSILLDPLDRRHRWHDPRAPWHSPHRFTIPHQCISCAAALPHYGRIYWHLPAAFTCPVHREKLHTRQSTRIGLMANRRAEVVPDQVYWLDEITCRGLATGNVLFFNATLPIGLWLQLLRTVIDELLVKYSQKPRATNFIREVWRAVGNRPTMSAGQSFESLKATRQIRLMHGAAVALKMIGSGDAYPFGASAHLLVPNPKPCRIAKTDMLQ